MSLRKKYRNLPFFREFEIIKDIIDIISISGLRGFWSLLNHSRQLKKYGRNFALMNSLIALEKCDLNKSFLAETGFDINSQKDFDYTTLATICEYLYEINILEMKSPGIYKARNKKQFQSLLQVMHACFAYHEPVQMMDRLLKKEYLYGQEVTRNDQYDAIASAEITSIFSYGLSKRVLDRVQADSLMDLGCGTGEFLSYLGENRFHGKLYGMDISEDAINRGKKSGFESEKINLYVGDIFDLANNIEKIKIDSIDIFSFMFVLHEFDDEQIKIVLKDIKDHYPQSKILLTELNNKTSEETKSTSGTVFPELKFVHRLSKQILRTPEEWVELFSEANFKATIALTNQLTNQLCFVFGQE